MEPISMTICFLICFYVIFITMKNIDRNLTAMYRLNNKPHSGYNPDLSDEAFDQAKKRYGGLPNGYAGMKWNHYDNRSGTKEELLDYFEKNVYKGRTIKEGFSVEKELDNIGSGLGNVCFYFEPTPEYLERSPYCKGIVEFIHVNIHKQKETHDH